MPSSLGPAEIMVILLVALIVLGPQKLPNAARQVGKTIAEVKRWSKVVQDDIRSVVRAEDATAGTGSAASDSTGEVRPPDEGSRRTLTYIPLLPRPTATAAPDGYAPDMARVEGAMPDPLEG
jgi:sec-independent protein translocase protein TatA